MKLDRFAVVLDARRKARHLIGHTVAVAVAAFVLCSAGLVATAGSASPAGSTFTLTASPVILSVLPLTLYDFTVQATFTGPNGPIGGAFVSFYQQFVLDYNDYPDCTTTTNAAGVATCTFTSFEILYIIAGDGYGVYATAGPSDPTEYAYGSGSLVGL